MTLYDVIGDVHGHVRELLGLLAELGYVEHDGTYRHPESRAVFIGDLIDRGPEQVETLRVVRAMVEADTALVPVIHGHYWRTGTPTISSPTIACVDYSAGKGGDLVAYRWRGEPTLRDDQFVSYPGQAARPRV